MSSRSSWVLPALSASCAQNAQAAESGLLYKVTSSVTLPSTDTYWHYIKMDPVSSRLSMAPVKGGLTVFDPASGKITAQVTVGNALDGLGIDEQRRRIVTSSNDGTLSVVAQKGPDRLELLGTVTTRPGARMSFLDQRNGNVYVVAADYTLPPGKNVDEIYHRNTFVVLTHEPQ